MGAHVGELDIERDLHATDTVFPKHRVEGLLAECAPPKGARGHVNAHQVNDDLLVPSYGFEVGAL